MTLRLRQPTQEELLFGCLLQPRTQSSRARVSQPNIKLCRIPTTAIRIIPECSFHQSIPPLTSNSRRVSLVDVRRLFVGRKQWAKTSSSSPDLRQRTFLLVLPSPPESRRQFPRRIHVATSAVLSSAIGKTSQLKTSPITPLSLCHHSSTANDPARFQSKGEQSAAFSLRQQPFVQLALPPRVHRPEKWTIPATRTSAPTLGVATHVGNFEATEDVQQPTSCFSLTIFHFPLVWWSS